MKSLQSRTPDLSLFSPATWPDYSLTQLKVGWIYDSSIAATNAPSVLELFPHLQFVQLETLDWEKSKDNWLELISFFEKIEVLLSLGEYQRDCNILSITAAMGRVVVTDNTKCFPFNHGETGLVIADGMQNIAEALLLLKNDPKLRTCLGKNLRRKYLELEKGNY